MLGITIKSVLFDFYLKRVHIHHLNLPYKFFFFFYKIVIDVRLKVGDKAFK